MCVYKVQYRILIQKSHCQKFNRSSKERFTICREYHEPRTDYYTSLTIKRSSKYEEHGAFRFNYCPREHDKWRATLDTASYLSPSFLPFVSVYHPGTYIVTLFSPAILELEFHLPLAAKVTLRSRSLFQLFSH